jgi:O-acetyl-ADP-ribose deacetylase (regulator of RNase III)
MREWKNSSVIALSQDGNRNPVQQLITAIKNKIYEAMEEGYSGPPFDPMIFASYLNIAVIPSGDVHDARIIQDGTKFCIEYNPNMPKARINFSIAHEIAHTFFPDCGDIIRNRLAINESTESEWELELLCNLGAAEMLMPTGSFPDLKNESINIENVLKLRKDYNVSVEAVLKRLICLTNEPISMFTASANKKGLYKIDYFTGSKTMPFTIKRNHELPKNSVVNACKAIGYTAQAEEQWSISLPFVKIECVGLPPYPGKMLPRVAGICSLNDRSSYNIGKGIKYITGDIFNPFGDGVKIIAHVVNNKANKWGGNGVANTMAKRWTKVFDDFSIWRQENHINFNLGNSKLCQLSESLYVFTMIAQNGYGFSEKPRIRYKALEQCLNTLGNTALELNGSVHMPKIGTGYAQGNWNVISEMIETEVSDHGIETTVYILPE